MYLHAYVKFKLSCTIGRIEKLNEGSDGHIRTAEIYLPNGRYVQRSISQLHPLEVPDKSNKVNQVSNEMEYGHSLQHAGRVQESKQVPIRKAVLCILCNPDLHYQP